MSKTDDLSHNLFMGIVLLVIIVSHCLITYYYYW